ncbi:M1 family metallopeptidase [Evansella clarkii]|uniref:M1 family metallopeptidase n=1 Tax=Evansella clarkii TaxID=79879 RepID=UPI000998BC2A|nr:M1 family metallopeptidase [Evansella clarkii]
MWKYRPYLLLFLLVTIPIYWLNNHSIGESFTPEPIQPGQKSNYEIELYMHKEETFKADVRIEITNNSGKEWEELVFYFIPNMFTEDSLPEQDNPPFLKIQSLTVQEEKTDYTIEEDMLKVPLKKKITPNETVDFQMSYTFTLPDEGFRFTKHQDNYHLAQWYPMVPTYHDGWNKQPFSFVGESYHTTFSDFIIKYNFPDEYTVVTSSDKDENPSKNKNSIRINNVKEVFIALLYETQVVEKNVENVNLRVFGSNEDIEFLEEILEDAASAFTYFQNTIGPYPHEQLDIILEGIGMEYPGVVTAGSVYGNFTNKESISRIVVHEIAHQWFYGIISNDPYFDAWLDEGITELVTSLFFYQEEEMEFVRFYERLEPMPSNMPLHKYPSNHSTYIYNQSMINLWDIFEEHGGIQTLENFLSEYYQHYKFQEVNTEEFVRFLKYYLQIEDDSLFEQWLNIN